MLSHLIQALSHRRTPAVIIVLSALFALSSIGAGFVTDDYTFLAALRSGARPFFDLFAFCPSGLHENRALVASGAYPWWTAPDFSLHLIRPLTSVALAFDSAVFGNHPLGYHLHSIAWYVALLVAAALILKRVIPGPAGSVALLIFALRSGHVLPYAWLSARHVLIAAVPATFGLYFHIRAAQDGWKPGRILAPLLLAVALCGSEIALAIVPFWLAHDLFQARASGSWKRALGSWAPALLIVVLYLVTYRIAGGVAASSGYYNNPLDAPAAFLHGAARHVPVLLANALLGIPGGFSPEHGVRYYVVTSVAGAALCALLFATSPLSHQERSSLKWLTPAALLALGLGISGPPWEHVLLVPDLGFSTLIGVLLWRGLGHAATSARQPVRAAATTLLVFAHVFAAPVASVRALGGLVQEGRATEAAAATAELGFAKHARVFVMGAADYKVSFYARDVFAIKAPGKVGCWSVLSATDGPDRMTRTGPRAFVLEPITPGAYDGYDGMFFGPRKYAVGDEVRQCGATIRIAALAQGKPSKLRVELDEPLESPGQVFLVWQDGRLRRFPLPVIGESTEIIARRRVPPSGTGPAVCGG